METWTINIRRNRDGKLHTLTLTLPSNMTGADRSEAIDDKLRRFDPRGDWTLISARNF